LFSFVFFVKILVFLF